MLRILILFCVICVNLTSYALSVKAPYAVLLDADTGAIIHSKNINSKMAPSSMSKLMTVYLVFEQLRERNIKLNDKFLVSSNAWRKGGSRTFLMPNTFVLVEDLLRGVIVQSGNDASVTLAEGLAGSEEVFVERMNAKAKEFGLSNSHFMNATGMPNNGHYMSPADIARISTRLIRDFPEYYHYFSEKTFVFNKIKQPNRNTLLHWNIGVDGLKTGHTDLGKYGMVVSAVKNGRRLICVVNGLEDEKARSIEAHKLLQYGFSNFTNIVISKQDSALLEIPVHLGKNQKVQVGTKEGLAFTVPIYNKGKNEIRIKYQSVVYAPLNKDKEVGEGTVKLYDGTIHKFKLYTLTNVEKLGFFKGLFARVKIWFKTFKFSGPKVEESVKFFMG